MQSPIRERQLQAEEQTVGHFALVAYIPDPLASFLDNLRLELTPACKPHAHVTILPPRPLHDDLKDTVQQIADDIRGPHPSGSSVAGSRCSRPRVSFFWGWLAVRIELRQLYASLNCGSPAAQRELPLPSAHHDRAEYPARRGGTALADREGKDGPSIGDPAVSWFLRCPSSSTWRHRSGPMWLLYRWELKFPSPDPRLQL